MILEMHCHTTEHSSCSQARARDIVQRNFELGLQGTVLTDHHYLWPPEALKKLREKVKVPHHYLILSGQEVTTPELGDVLVYGAQVSLQKGSSLKTIRRRYPEAAIIWAHPYRHENIPSRHLLLHPMIDGVEIFNSNHTVAESNHGLQDWHRYKFTALAGTDTHALSIAGLYSTVFDHPVETMSELAREIRAGRCRPSLQEIPRSGSSSTRVMEITIGNGLHRDLRKRYVVKKYKNYEKWHSAALRAKVIDEIRAHGFENGRFRIPKPLADDPGSLLTFEEGIKGKTLFEKLIEADPPEARDCLEMAAEWLVRLHNCRLQILPPEEFYTNEERRLRLYLSGFYNTGNRHTRRAREIMDRVLEAEEGFYGRHPDRLVQGHGDYHPKNIYVGQDPKDCTARFVAAIDFDSTYTMPPAFDVGTFLAQFRNQFYGHREVLAKVDESVFLHRYLKEALYLDKDFLSQVDVFRARTSLSIAYYLINLNLGEGENLYRVLIEAERYLAGVSLEKGPVHQPAVGSIGV